MDMENVLTCPEGMYRKEVTITQAQVDASGEMTPGALLRLMQDVSVEHLLTLGLDGDTMESHGYLWMLVRTALSIERMPRVGETVYLHTWFGAEKMWMIPGFYVCYSADGTLMAGAASQWMMVDVETRRLAEPPEIMKSLPVLALADAPALPARRVKLPAELPLRRDFTVQSHEIDRNGHMNNTFYVDWVTELAGDTAFRGRKTAFLWIEYARELLLGQTATLEYAKEEETLFVKGSADSGESFTLKMDFNPCE